MAVVAGTILFATSVRGADVPQFYADGARPTRTADQTYLEDQGCVPFSEERPDVKICGEIPEGWEPGKPPGNDSIVCEQAEHQFAAERRDFENLLSAEELASRYPQLDSSSCHVIPTGSYPNAPEDRPEYFVIFEPRNGGEAIRVSVNVSATP